MSSLKLSSLQQNISYQAVLLGGFTLLATVLLVAGNMLTKDVIELRQKEDLLASLGQVVPEQYYDNDLLSSPIVINDEKDQPVTIFRGMLENQVSAVAYEISEPGYSGVIRLIIGIDKKGQILGVRVLSHTETPGLGDKIEANRDDWILGFNGLSLGNPPVSKWKVNKDGGQFDAFSGATITPRAVVKAIENGLVFFRDNQTELLIPPLPPVPETDDTTQE